MRPPLPVLLFLAVACSEKPGSARAESAAARITEDASGVLVIEYSTLESASPALTLSPEPTLKIGGFQDDERYEFLRPIVAATELSDGRLVIAMHADTAFRIFDSTGKYVRTVGRAGNGPGDFEGISNLCVTRGDTVVVFDGQERRVTVISAAGGVSAVSTLDRPLLLIGCLADGTVVATSYGRPAEEKPPSGTHGRNTVRVARVDVQPRAQILHETPEIAGNSIGIPISGYFMSRPFGFMTSVIPDGERIHVADPGSLEIRTYSAAWKLDRVIRLLAPAKPVTEAMRDAYRRKTVNAAMAIRRERIAAVLDREETYPATLPAYRTVIADRTSRLWVQQSPNPSDAADPWWVFGSDGRLIGTSMIPADLRILEIGRDYLHAWRIVEREDEKALEFVRFGIVPVGSATGDLRPD